MISFTKKIKNIKKSQRICTVITVQVAKVEITPQSIDLVLFGSNIKIPCPFFNSILVALYCRIFLIVTFILSGTPIEDK